MRFEGKMVDAKFSQLIMGGNVSQIFKLKIERNQFKII